MLKGRPMNGLLVSITFILAAGVAAAADAAVLQFSGSFQNVTPPGAPGGRCGPPPILTLTFAPEATSGVSNLGAFTVSASHCVLPTPPVTNYGDGEFTWFFGSGDELHGTYTGVFTILPGGTAQTVQNYLVTGGAGRFNGASGAFQHQGTVAFGPGGVTTGEATFEGSITTVPEPSTWGMMLLGFGAMGAAVRQKRRPALVALS
jgi:hypothetical protein